MQSVIQPLQAHGAPAQPAMPKKVRATRKPWSPERYANLAKAVAASAKAIGSSFVKPANAAAVPKDAPESGEWNGISNTILGTIPTYADLYDKRKKVNAAEKGHNGGLEQHVYVSKQMTDFLNTCGVLNGKNFPVDMQAGGLGIATRALLTSSIVAYVESRGLKHPIEKKYIMPDQYLAQLIGPTNFEALKTAKPKVEKKRKEGAKPKKNSPKVAVLERDGHQVPHFSFDAIPTLSNYFIIDLAPRNVTAEQKAAVAATREHLTKLTEGRKEVRKAQTKQARDDKKAQTVRNSIVPTQVLTLTMNTNPGQPQAQQFAQPQQQFVQPQAQFGQPPAQQFNQNIL